MQPGQNPYIVTAANSDDAKQALAVIEDWMEPALLDRLIVEIGELYYRTRREKETDASKEVVIALYARELHKLPADITIEAIQNFRGVFFPALDVIRVPIETDVRLRERKARAKALRAFLVNGPDDDTPRQMTDDVRAAVSSGFKKLRAELGGIMEKPKRRKSSKGARA